MYIYIDTYIRIFTINSGETEIVRTREREDERTRRQKDERRARERERGRGDMWSCTCVRRACISLMILCVKFVILFNYTCMGRRADVCVACMRDRAAKITDRVLHSVARFGILECEFVRYSDSLRPRLGKRKRAGTRAKIENGVISMEILIIRNSTSSDHSAPQRKCDSFPARYREWCEISMREQRSCIVRVVWNFMVTFTIALALTAFCSIRFTSLRLYTRIVVACLQRFAYRNYTGFDCRL